MPQSRRLRPSGESGKRNICSRLKIAAVAATAAAHVTISYIEAYFRLKIAAVAATAAGIFHTAGDSLSPPQDCRSRGDCGHEEEIETAKIAEPPQDCRSRGDCGDKAERKAIWKICRLKIAAVAATAAQNPSLWELMFSPPQDCRSRGDCGTRLAGRRETPGGRLKIAAVAATAASRSRRKKMRVRSRLKIAAVAATAASSTTRKNLAARSASRLPQSRRLRQLGFHVLVRRLNPPQDCRSRGDCGR